MSIISNPLFTAGIGFVLGLLTWFAQQKYSERKQKHRVLALLYHEEVWLQPCSLLLLDLLKVHAIIKHDTFPYYRYPGLKTEYVVGVLDAEKRRYTPQESI